MYEFNENVAKRFLSECFQIAHTHSYKFSLEYLYEFLREYGSQFPKYLQAQRNACNKLPKKSQTQNFLSNTLLL